MTAGRLWRPQRVSSTFLFVISCPPIIRMAGKGNNVLKIVAGELAMLEILVVLARRQVDWRTATAATANQAIFVSTNVYHLLIARGICAFLAQSQKDCRVVTLPDKQRQTTKNTWDLKGMLPLPLQPNTRVFTQMSTSPVGHKRMLLLQQ